MNGAVAPGLAATAPQERGWRWFVLGLVLMVAVTAAPAWPPTMALIAGAVRLLLPVEQFALLVLVAIAACATVGWWAGGRLVLALLWVSAAAYVLWRVPLPLSGYGAFLRGWSVTLGAAFGLVCLASPARPLLTRAIGAIGLAVVITLAGFSARSIGPEGTFEAAGQMFSREYQHRLGESLESWRARSASDAWRGFARRFPEAVERTTRVEAVLVALAAPLPASGAVGGARPGPLVGLVPAVLALESWLARTRGWAGSYPGPRGLDRGVQGQQIGLLGQAGDRRDDPADALRAR